MQPSSTHKKNNDASSIAIVARSIAQADMFDEKTTRPLVFRRNYDLYYETVSATDAAKNVAQLQRAEFPPHIRNSAPF